MLTLGLVLLDPASGSGEGEGVGEGEGEEGEGRNMEWDSSRGFEEELGVELRARKQEQAERGSPRVRHARYSIPESSATFNPRGPATLLTTTSEPLLNVPFLALDGWLTGW